MIPSLLHADEAEPGRCFGKKLHACGKSRTEWLHVSAGHLWGYGEEELVDAAARQESAKQGGAAFMQKQRNAEFIAEKFQNGSRRNHGTFERPNLRRNQQSCSTRREKIFTGFGRDDQSSYAGCPEYGSCEV